MKQGLVEELELREGDEVSLVSTHRPEQRLDVLLRGRVWVDASLSTSATRAEAPQHELELLQTDGALVVQIEEIKIEADELRVLALWKGVVLREGSSWR
jgi:hypothetical protein